MRILTCVSDGLLHVYFDIEYKEQEVLLNTLLAMKLSHSARQHWKNQILHGFGNTLHDKDFPNFDLKNSLKLRNNTDIKLTETYLGH